MLGGLGLTPWMFVRVFIGTTVKQIAGMSLKDDPRLIGIIVVGIIMACVAIGYIAKITKR